jgi:hypothetical protein
LRRGAAVFTTKHLPPHYNALLQPKIRFSKYNFKMKKKKCQNQSEKCEKWKTENFTLPCRPSDSINLDAKSQESGTDTNSFKIDKSFSTADNGFSQQIKANSSPNPVNCSGSKKFAHKKYEFPDLFFMHLNT